MTTTKNTKLLVLFSAVMTLGISAYGQGKKASQSAPAPATPAAETEASAPKESDRIDIQKLEEKYWSAKDADFSVVQNRTYTKAKRINLSVTYGIPVNDPYSDGSILGVSTSWFFNERHGISLDWQKASLTDNDSTETFKNERGAFPNGTRLVSNETIAYNIVPFYAKMSFWDRHILYFDMGFSFGAGMTHYEQMTDEGNTTKTAPHVSLGFHQVLFFSRNLSLRFDLMNKWTTVERKRYRLDAASGNTDRNLGNKNVNDTSLLFGVTYWH